MKILFALKIHVWFLCIIKKNIQNRFERLNREQHRKSNRLLFAFILKFHVFQNSEPTSIHAFNRIMNNPVLLIVETIVHAINEMNVNQIMHAMKRDSAAKVGTCPIIVNTEETIGISFLL